MKTKRKIYQYTAVFEKNELGGYTVTVPTLPGLVTEGKNLQEAMTMAEDAIRCYVEGLRKQREAIPEETSVGSFRLNVPV
jgi:antitoxin HicB